MSISLYSPFFVLFLQIELYLINLFQKLIFQLLRWQIINIVLTLAHGTRRQKQAFYSIQGAILFLSTIHIATRAHQRRRRIQNSIMTAQSAHTIMSIAIIVIQISRVVITAAVAVSTVYGAVKLLLIRFVFVIQKIRLLLLIAIQIDEHVVGRYLISFKKKKNLKY